MGQPIRIRFCPNCNTGIREDLQVCPECGAGMPHTPPSAPPAGGPDTAGRDPFADLFRDGVPSGRQASGALLRAFLGPHLGCLTTALAFLFGVPLLVGILAGEVLGVLGVLLLVTSSLGLALTGATAWLLWSTRPPRGPRGSRGSG